MFNSARKLTFAEVQGWVRQTDREVRVLLFLVMQFRLFQIQQKLFSSLQVHSSTRVREVINLRYNIVYEEGSEFELSPVINLSV